MGVFSLVKFLFVRLVELIVIFTLILIMPSIPPHAKYEQQYRVTPPQPLQGKLAINEKLSNAELWHKGDFVGAEAFADFKGELYTGISGGDIVKLVGNHIVPVTKFGKPCKGLYEEKICGRVLGIVFDKAGSLYAADAYNGIYKVDIVTGNHIQLVSKDQEIAGVKPKLFNSIALASNGDIYWTDSSTEFYLEDGVFDMLADGSGRLIHYNAKTKENKVLIENIHFANGVAFSADEEFIIVSETARSRLLRYYLKGPKAGTSDVFIDGLPGLPDNLKSDGQGGFLVPLVLSRNKDHPILFQSLGPFPRIRKLISRVMGLGELAFTLLNQLYPNEFCQRSVHMIGHFTSMSFLNGPKQVTILHVTGKGEVADSLHTTSGKFESISEVHIFNELLYLGSPFADQIVRIPLATVGWQHLAPIKVKTTTTPKPTTTTPKPTTTTPKPTTTSPKPTTTTPKPTTTTPKPTTTTPKPTTTTPKPTTTTPKPTTTTPKPTTTTPQPTTTTPKPTTTTSKPTTTTPKPAATTPESTTATPKPTTTQKPTTTTTKPTTTTQKPTTSTPEPATTPKPVSSPPVAGAQATPQEVPQQKASPQQVPTPEKQKIPAQPSGQK